MKRSRLVNLREDRQSIGETLNRVDFQPVSPGSVLREELEGLLDVSRLRASPDEYLVVLLPRPHALRPHLVVEEGEGGAEVPECTRAFMRRR